jgi:hypothetical protein
LVKKKEKIEKDDLYMDDFYIGYGLGENNGRKKEKNENLSGKYTRKELNILEKAN